MKKILSVLLILPFFVNAQMIRTTAGTGIPGYSGDGGSAVSAQLAYPSGVTIDRSGNIYIADAGYSIIRKINTTGIITTIAGTGAVGYSGDGGPATLAKLRNPNHLAFDQIGNIYIADNYSVVRKVDTFGIITTYAGSSTTRCCGDGGPATAAGFSFIGGIAMDIPGNLYIVDGSSNQIRRVDTMGIVSSFAGNGSVGSAGDGGPATNAQLNPLGVCTDRFGNVYIADGGNFLVRKVNTSGIISKIAGNGDTTYLGDGIAAVATGLFAPWDVAADDSGNIFIADRYNHAIRKVDRWGIISTVAGVGTPGYSGDGGSAVAAEINSPKGVAFKNNIVYVADYENHVIRSINIDPMTLKLSSVDNDQHIIVYPNPATEVLSISGRDPIKTVTISNVIGHIVYQNCFDDRTVDIDIKTLPSSMYFININHTEVRKFVKMP